MNDQPTTNLPCKDILVLEIASVLAGPLVGMFFAELGARVIKVENQITRGDSTRHWRNPSEDKTDDRSSYFISANAGKESIVLDFNNQEDMLLLRRVIKKADIMITNFKSGDDTKFGLTYGECSTLNPTLIYASISGYGQNDTRAGYDAVVQAESGFMSINGQPNSPPTKLPVALIDVLTAHQMKEAILLALLQRQESGIGSYLHTSLIDTALSSLANQVSNALNTSFQPRQSGSDHPNIVPYGTLFRTSDNQQVLFAVGTDKQFRLLCTILELEEVAYDDRFATNDMRVKNKQVLLPIIESAVRLRESGALLKECELHSIPVGLVQSVNQAVESERARDLIITAEQKAKTIRSFVAQSNNFSSVKFLSSAPRLDEHGLAIRGEFAE
jgi:crotonobetainyl-CoA:carnitine CoA-transferase CaiB-like acyl-CoA transferase